jgi:phosphopantothenoylcysteine decarboxylase/phosphopantothenate--cysteine ligase
MNCIVTGGPTYESLDEVRRLTNFSTGQLGSELANFLTARGHQVTLLIGQQATFRGERNAHRIEAFTTTADLRARLQSLGNKRVRAVFHAAAVSDFTFGKIFQRTPTGNLTETRASKLTTRSGALLAELLPTPKIISKLRTWFPTACIVGWKFEVDGNRASALAKARRQLKENHTDACVANGRAYGEGFGLVTRARAIKHCADMQELFEALERLLKRRQ